jgi:hypothetical protein
VNGDNGYIAMQVSGLEVLPGAGLTDSGRRQTAIEIQEKIIEAEASMKRFTNGDITARQAYSSAIRDLKRRLDQRAELSAFSKRVLQAYRNKPLVEQILAAA